MAKARKCKPGLICITNLEMFLIILLICAGIYYLYHYFKEKKFNSNSNMNGNSQMTNQMMSVGVHSHTSPSILQDPRDGFMQRGLSTSIATDVYSNPYAAPLRDPRIYPRLQNSLDVRGGIPINIRTQGYNTSYRQVGILKRLGTSDDTILPLFGRPLMANRDKWQFYTINDKFHGIKLPVVSRGKSCTNEYGCDDLMNGDTVYVEGYNDAFKVTIYDTNLPEYIPFI